MREHSNNLSKIQTQNNKSESKTKITYGYFLKYLYSQPLKVSYRYKILRLTIFPSMLYI
ncbi:hypothetical protein SAMN04487992_11021 [Cellulophaga baltica]|uniref:Uncharacterized protein n=1 Tax=Cellulophaga baltica TaxID=76594 RepID=A0A1G7JNS0_9FLAO|nr:hypothetical protein SAMN04487992_11021 [Cellulophaga baltica]